MFLIFNILSIINDMENGEIQSLKHQIEFHKWTISRIQTIIDANDLWRDEPDACKSLRGLMKDINDEIETIKNNLNPNQLPL